MVQDFKVWEYFEAIHERDENFKGKCKKCGKECQIHAKYGGTSQIVTKIKCVMLCFVKLLD